MYSTMSNFKVDCRKFQPNIFSKIKCSNCFRQREEHSVEALESNRASRKVSKCGYLFVAPDWDFSIPLYRTKRWQRRWFVLYDDGELSYSVDDHPATVPQGVVEMTRVHEVSEAEDVTGNQYSLAITAPDRVTFVKGTCREESRWWFDVLSVFPLAQKSHGRHKRNATFPGIKTSSLLQQSRTARAHTPSPSLGGRYDSAGNQRLRFHSCTTESLVTRPSSAPALDADEDVFPTKDLSSINTPSSSANSTQNNSVLVSTPSSPGPPSTPLYHSTPLSSLPPSTRLLRDEHKENTPPPYNEDYTDNPPTSESPPTQDKLSHLRRTRRTAKREARGLMQPRSDAPRQQQILLTDLEETKREEKLKDIADSITRLRGNTSLPYLNNETGDKPTRERDVVDHSSDLHRKQSGQDTLDSSHQEQIRGAPDGCGLEGSPPYLANSDLQRVDLPAEDLLYIKKGWLMKQGLNQDLHKYWFVLHGTGLRYYRDPGAEDNGILDGIVDLGMAKSVEECEAPRNYGFMITNWEDKKYTFSAVTAGIRGNWVQALRNAANLREPKGRPLTLGEKIEREIVAKRERTASQSTYESLPAERDQSITDLNNDTRSTNNSRCVMSDEDYKTASELSARSQLNNISQDDFFEWERSRSRSNSRTRVSNRSRSSPPSSRRNTSDDYPTVPRDEPTTSCYSETGSLHSITDIDDRNQPEKDSSAGTLNGSGEAVLVDLLETQVESLKAKLEQTQLNQQPSSQSQHIIEQNQNKKLHQYAKSNHGDTSFVGNGENVSALKLESSRFIKKLEVLEADLDRSEREVDKLQVDKEGLTTESRDLKRRLNSLENQVTELVQRMEHQNKDINEKSSMITHLSEIKKKLLEERKEWSEKLANEEKNVRTFASTQTHQEGVIRQLTTSAHEADQKISALTCELESTKSASSLSSSTSGKRNNLTAAHQVNKLNIELAEQVDQLTAESNRLRDSVKSEKSEVYKWKDLVKELRSLLDGRNDEIERRRDEVGGLRENLKSTQQDLDRTSERLHQGIDENDHLYSRVKELERQLQSQEKSRRASSTLSISSNRDRSSSRRSIPRLDSLSDLTNFDLNIEPEELDKEQLVDEYTEIRTRFEKAVNEIHALKKEVKEAQNKQDELELVNVKSLQDLKNQKEDFNSQNTLMTSRIGDLTIKLSNSDKQVRMLKQKVSRAESKDRRRTQSLKGRESFTLSRDMEVKLSQLETKLERLGQIESVLPNVAEEGKSTTLCNSKLIKIARRSKSFEESTKSSRLRRKSLDSPSGSEAVKAIVRINNLESKLAEVSGQEMRIISPQSISSSQSNNTTLPSSIRPKSPTYPVSPLRSPLRSPSLPRKNMRNSSRVTPEKSFKVSRSDSETKHLKEKVTGLEKVLSTLQSQLSECLTWAGSVECVCSCGAPGLSSLQQRLNSAYRIAQMRHTSRDQAAVSRLRPFTTCLQDILCEKIGQLTQRRYQLKTSGKWTRDSQLKSFAERLAFETMMASQIAQCLQAAHRPDSYEASLKLQDIIESHRKLSFLEKKLTNPDFDMDTLTPLDFYTSLLAEKLVVEGEVQSSLIGPQSSYISPNIAMNDTCRDLQSRLLDRERNLSNLVTQYKEDKLHEIAIVMARETVAGMQPQCDDSVLLEELRLREAWAIAQDIVSQELINLEASQSLLRLSNLLVPGSHNETLLSSPTAATLDRLHTAAEESLRQEMEESVLILSNKYESVLAQYRSGDNAIINSISASIETVLAEFAAVIAQKAVIDGQLAVVQGEGEGSSSETLAIVEETRDPIGSASDVAASEAHLLMFLGAGDSALECFVQPALTQAEFTFLYNKANGHCINEVTSLLSILSQQNLEKGGSAPSLKFSSSPASASDKDLEGDSLLLGSLGGSKVVPSPKAKRKSDSSRRSRRVSDITGMIDRCRQCEELRQEIGRLRKNLELKRLKQTEAECKHCIEYVNKLKTLEEDHRKAMTALQTEHKAEIERLRDQVKHDPPTRDSDDELTELKRRLCLLEEGYEAQIAALKKQYDDSKGGQSQITEENIRQRYQVEIEQLRGLCEKGLGAMENSNKRMLTELEEKHRRELGALQAEKDQALAEETQATLAALDAMRKAHEAEVQRETTKFKEEFIRQMQSGHDLGALHRQHEAEMQDIRKEILSLSDKYSIKCLESAALEEKVGSLNRHLSDASRQILDLETRNKQLRAHLSAHIAQLQRDSGKEATGQLRIQESELALRNEEISRLKQQLQNAQFHEADLGELCGQLGNFLRAERQLRTHEVSALRDKLEHIILTAANMQEQICSDGSFLPSSSCMPVGSGGSEGEDRTTVRRGSSVSTTPNSTPTKVLARSPSCPRLSGFSSFLSNGPSLGGARATISYQDLPSPLAGMVASRKKVFETPSVRAVIDNF